MLIAEGTASVAAAPPPTAIDGDPGVNRDGWGVALAMTLPELSYERPGRVSSSWQRRAAYTALAGNDLLASTGSLSDCHTLHTSAWLRLATYNKIGTYVRAVIS